MMQFRLAAKLVAVFGYLVLAACAPSVAAPTESAAVTGERPVSSQPSPPREATPDALSSFCPAKDLQYLVGQPRTVLHTMRFGGEVRIEEPGQAVTADFRSSRTRIVIGTDGKIKSVACG